MEKIILASASPRRRELLQQVGLEFEVVPARGEEIITKTRPDEVVCELSGQKAREVAERVKREMTGGLDESFVIIGADTVVCQDGKIMGKPRSRADAVKMIEHIQGRKHSVFTGVTILRVTQEGETACRNFACETKVEVYPMKQQEIQAYVDMGEIIDKTGNASGNKAANAAGNMEEMKKAGWLDDSGNWKTDNGHRPECLDKAGAYGIQGRFAAWVKGIEGDYNNVVGLPVSAVWQALKA